MDAQDNVTINIIGMLLLLLILIVAIILILLIIIAMNIIIHELGHYLIARYFGCRLRKLQLSIFYIERLQNEYQLRFNIKNLFTGSCDLILPSYLKKYQAIGIALGGVLFNVISLITYIVIGLIVQGVIGILSIICSIYALLIIIANLISFKNIYCCDGSIAYSIYKNDGALEGYIRYQIIRDKLYCSSYDELEEKLFIIDTYSDNYCDVNCMYGLLYIKYLIGKKQYKTAMIIIETYLDTLHLIKKDIAQGILLELVYVRLMGYQGANLHIYIKAYGIQEFTEDKVHSGIDCYNIDRLRVYTAFLIIYCKEDINIYDVIEKGRQAYERGDYIYGDYVFFLNEMNALRCLKGNL